MARTLSWPGIYTEEINGSPLTINSSSAVVPAFIFTRTNSALAGKKTAYYFTNWAEINAIIPETEKDNDRNPYYAALWLWFNNSGGPCHLLDYAYYQDYLSKHDDITLVVACDRNKNVINEIDNLCGPGKNRFVLLDGPKDKIPASQASQTTMAEYPVTPYAAAWYPWCKSARFPIAIPPSVVAAIAIAQTDRSRGVWKSPSNITLNGLTPRWPVSDSLQGQFSSGKALNMIRTFLETGATLWGARTLEDSDNWRYIAVRRLVSQVESDISIALQPALFEPNTDLIWQRVKTSVSNYLYNLWQQGALMGNTPEEAFYVRIGRNITMSDEDIRQGKMVVKIGLAASRPAEFIELQFSQLINPT